MSTSSSVMAPRHDLPGVSGPDPERQRVAGPSKVQQRVVREYAEAMTRQLAEGGLQFPPIVLFTDGQDYWVGDGCHRVEAALQIS